MSVFISSCGTTGIVERSFVEEGTPSEEICSIVEVKKSESTSGKVKSYIWKIDEKSPADFSSIKSQLNDDFRDGYKIFINPGNHSIEVGCSWGLLHDRTFFTLEFDAIKGHNYAAKCEIIGYMRMFSCKQDGWVEIIDIDTHEVVSKSDVLYDTCF